MTRRLSSRAKRSAMVAVATVAAVIASLFVASPAFAYSQSCRTHYLSTVTFEVCVKQFATNGAYATVQVLGGSSYISGTLYLNAGNASYGSCSGKHYFPSFCKGSNIYGGTNRGYDATWQSAGGGVYSSGGILL